MAEVVEYFFSVNGKYLYTGIMNEGDRLATANEVSYWLANGSILADDVKAKLSENTEAYGKALVSPLKCGDYYVVAEWVSTYANTLQYAQRVEAKGETVSANSIVFNAVGALVNILITSLAEFEPFYDVVADEWARITDKRNLYMCEIQNSQSPKSIVIDYKA